MWCAALVGVFADEGRRGCTSFRLTGVRGWLVAGFEELVSETRKGPSSGWDFPWWAARSRGRLPWSQRREVARRAAAADVMLDMGTRLLCLQLLCLDPPWPAAIVSTNNSCPGKGSSSSSHTRTLGLEGDAVKGDA